MLSGAVRAQGLGVPGVDGLRDYAGTLDTWALVLTMTPNGTRGAADLADLGILMVVRAGSGCEGWGSLGTGSLPRRQCCGQLVPRWHLLMSQTAGGPGGAPNLLVPPFPPLASHPRSWLPWMPGFALHPPPHSLLLLLPCGSCPPSLADDSLPSLLSLHLLVPPAAVVAAGGSGEGCNQD